MISFIQNSRKFHFLGMESRTVVARGMGKMGKGWEEGITQEETFRVMKMYIFLIVMMVSNVYKYVKTYHIVHFKYVLFVIG